MKHINLVVRFLIISAFYLSIFLLVDYFFVYNAKKHTVYSFLSSLLLTTKSYILLSLAIFAMSLLLLFLYSVVKSKRTRRVVQEGFVEFKDAFGGIEKMKGAPLHHHLDSTIFPSTLHYQPEKLIEELQLDCKHPDSGAQLLTHSNLSNLEKDMLALLYHYRAWPADIANYHGTTLLHHSFSTWKNAVSKSEVGSPAAIIALAHDLGKLIAYTPEHPQKLIDTFAYTADKKAKFRRLSVKHEVLNPTVFRKLPSYVNMDEAARKPLLLALYTLARTPGFTPDIQNDAFDILSVKKAIAADVATTAGEVQKKSAAEQNACTSSDTATAQTNTESPQTPSNIPDSVPDADQNGYSSDEEFLDALLQVIDEQLIPKLCKLNINRHRDASGPIDGISFVSNQNLVILCKSVRKTLVDILPEEMKDHLRLDTATKDATHPSDAMIAQALVNGGYILRSFEGFETPNCAFHFRSGKVRLDACFVFLSDRFSKSAIESFGDWNREMELIKL